MDFGTSPGAPQVERTWPREGKRMIPGATLHHPSSSLAACRIQDRGYWIQDTEGRILNTGYRTNSPAGSRIKDTGHTVLQDQGSSNMPHSLMAPKGAGGLS